MPQPAACITFPQVCPMFTGPVPHVGGVIVGPGSPTVLICGQPGSCMGDTCICAGPPSTIIFGSPTVLHEGRPAVRMGDPTDHGGVVVLGVPNRC